MSRVLLVWLAALLTTPVFAETRARQSTRDLIDFNRVDSDHNGYVSRVEARSIVVAETRFDTADANEDGLLDRDEYVSLRMAGEAD